MAGSRRLLRVGPVKGCRFKGGTNPWPASRKEEAGGRDETKKTDVTQTKGTLLHAVSHCHTVAYLILDQEIAYLATKVDG